MIEQQHDDKAERGVSSARVRELCAAVDAERAADKAKAQMRNEQAELQAAEPQFGKLLPRAVDPTPTTPGWIAI